VIGTTKQYKVLFFTQLQLAKVLLSQGIQRNHFQILKEILDICREPQTRTQIMCKTGVTIKKLQFCLRQLLKQNMVRFHHRKRTYVTTEEGLRYLQSCVEIQKD
jgi:predicted transcriptional regulator